MHRSSLLVPWARELRHTQTVAEADLWARLRDRQLGGYKFRRQYPADRFILDFYCPSSRLILELDGEYHGHPDQAEYDAARTAWLEASDCRVLRFPNAAIAHDLDAVLAAILQACVVVGPPR